MPTSTLHQIPSQEANYYTILSLPSSPPPTPHLLRTAYRRALLLHHPDKSPSNSQRAAYSIDQITAAYTTLANPVQKKEYDQRLQIQKFTIIPTGKAAVSPSATEERQYSGLETVDLEDMNFTAADDGDEMENEGERWGLYWRGCRCGRERGFELPEKVLEAYAEEGEVVVGCAGCSLWLRVVFAVAEDSEDGKEERKEGHARGDGQRLHGVDSG